MPTPSGNAPDPSHYPPRNFSSCPDPEDSEQQPQQTDQQQQGDEQQSPIAPASPSSQTPDPADSVESQTSWRPGSSSSNSRFDPLAPTNSSTSPRSPTMSPMSSSVAAALADGSGDYDEPPVERRGIGIGIIEPMEMDDDEEEEGQKDDDDEDMGLETSSPEAHFLGLIRRIDELNARDEARDAERSARVAGGGTVSNPPSTSRRRPDAVRSRSTTDYATRVGDGASSSSTRNDEPEEPGWGPDASMLGMGYEYADPRVIPISPSTYLRPGSRFHGTQQSERQRYDVQVEIKHVDLRESFLCGYLRIQGLTEDHPTLTTYFEGEIIGSKYGFATQHPSWGASDKTDLSHWAKFQAFRPFQKQMKKGAGLNSVAIKDVANRENIFMRWKEHFLVPDHRVRTIHGASFEGFYYICFNQVRGEVSGIYFHSKSEKFQQLELQHVEDKGCHGAVEFR
ncbi:vacuolar import and degradation protein-domain-containing protein [Coniochaeta sp. 2T2.1]|nr:vacuolar import and degradation protein-domain-containing protein [Coniochaeta sp. 2T2.1]